jgi:hypothetical protein
MKAIYCGDDHVLICLNSLPVLGVGSSGLLEDFHGPPW